MDCRLSSILKTWLLTLSLALVSCASDNIHRPSPDDPYIPLDRTYTGSFVTSVPDFPVFDAVVSPQVIRVSEDAAGDYTVETEPFDISISLMARDIHIGAMVITGVEGVDTPEGLNLFIENFEVPGGDYIVKGSLTGSLTDSNLTLTMDYRPGSMPFNCHSVFVQSE